ncbi:TAXI family TRAP transporter solute-binding subunit [Polynucleobacter necessarius]|uniref:TAXI family TRAP transporter solute-binding subunit n=1 Tax=Polynucleobacter necessarius TaxID=576610 RepID=UPI001E4D7A64|nr:TAXI family TRAP transporter solute-binding subunit [Polynucleobacter necessarius]
MNFIKRQIYNPMAIVAVFFMLLIILFGVLWILIPPPPKSTEMATGLPTGLYYQFGERLKAELAKDGVDLKVRSTGGTLDNLALLNDPKSGVDFGMVQGGVTNWVWYREDAFKGDGGQLKLLSQLKGKNVSIGNDGSGTLALVKDLLQASGITDKEIGAQKLKPDDAIVQLRSGELDAVFVVAAAETPILRKFYSVPGIRLMGFDQADAYTRNWPY